MNDTPAIDEAPEMRAPKKASTQLLHSMLGEIVGYTVSNGAVYLAYHLLPHQTRAVTQKLAEKIAQRRGTHAQQQFSLAKEVVDVTLMNIAGLSNMGVQFSLHRASMKPEDKPPLAHELGRLITGRVVGTTTALGTLALAHTYTPKAMASTQHFGSKLLGNTPKTDRFSELLLSNIIQSAGALVGNVPAQLLYDKVVGNNLSKSDHQPSMRAK